MNHILIKLIAVLLAGAALPGSAVARERQADLVIVNGYVHTVDKRMPRAAAVAVKDGRIIAVGSDREIRSFVTKATRTIDAHGRLVLPGFNDSHTHILGIGNLFTSLDLRNVRSAKEIARRIEEYAVFLPKGRWVLGGGWDVNDLEPGGLPTKDLIDDVSPKNPVLLYNSDATMALANSVALKLAGIDRERGDIHDGKIVRDANQRPTGILIGKAIQMVKIFTRLAPLKEKLEVIETASNYAASYGITSLQDMSTDNNIEAIRQLDHEGRLKTRIYECIGLKDWSALAAKGIKRASGNGLLRYGCVKSFADGSANNNPPNLYDNIAAADKAGLQIMIHAIGPRANAFALSLFERVIRANGPRDRRLRVEHAQRLRRSDIRRFGADRIIASMQPRLFLGSGPYRALIRGGARIAFGSDASISDIDPLAGIAAAVLGKDPSHAGNNAISVGEAVRFYTMGSAYAEFQEKAKGSVTVGKLADLVILSENIFRIAPQSIAGVKVMETIVGGRVVFERR